MVFWQPSATHDLAILCDFVFRVFITQHQVFFYLWRQHGGPVFYCSQPTLRTQFTSSLPAPIQSLSLSYPNTFHLPQVSRILPQLTQAAVFSHDFNQILSKVKKTTVQSWNWPNAKTIFLKGMNCQANSKSHRLGCTHGRCHTHSTQVGSHRVKNKTDEISFEVMCTKMPWRSLSERLTNYKLFLVPYRTTWTVFRQKKSRNVNKASICFREKQILVCVFRWLNYEHSLLAPLLFDEDIQVFPGFMKEAWSTLTVRRKYNEPTFIVIDDWLKERAIRHEERKISGNKG